jgi:hypothetical protein
MKIRHRLGPRPKWSLDGLGIVPALELCWNPQASRPGVPWSHSSPYGVFPAAVQFRAQSVSCGCQMAVWYDRFWTSFHQFLSQFIPVQYTPHRGEIWILAAGYRCPGSPYVPLYVVSVNELPPGFTSTPADIVCIWSDSMQSVVYSKKPIKNKTCLAVRQKRFK